MRAGALSTALHNLRLVQEVVFKMLAFQLEPALADKPRVTPGEVRKLVESRDFPHWREFYDNLSEVSHHNRDFVLKAYPDLDYVLPESAIGRAFVEYHLLILIVLDMRALNVAYIRLEDTMGSDYQKLVKRHRKLEIRVDNAWNRVHTKTETLLKNWTSK